MLLTALVIHIVIGLDPFLVSHQNSIFDILNEEHLMTNTILLYHYLVFEVKLLLLRISSELFTTISVLITVLIF